jgi:hypothetical protein
MRRIKNIDSGRFTRFDNDQIISWWSKRTAKLLWISDTIISSSFVLSHRLIKLCCWLQLIVRLSVSTSIKSSSMNDVNVWLKIWTHNNVIIKFRINCNCNVNNSILFVYKRHFLFWINVTATLDWLTYKSSCCYWKMHTTSLTIYESNLSQK